MDSAVVQAQREVNASAQDAYQANLTAHRPGATLKETVEQYETWARQGTYEQVCVCVHVCDNFSF